MSVNGRVGILSTLTAPLLPLLLTSLYAEGIDDLCVILDKNVLSDKDKRIFQERTNGAFDGIDIGLYDFCSECLPFYMVRNHNGEDCVALLKGLNLAVIINGGTPRKLRAGVLGAARQGVINVHPGVLPKYRGASCVEWAILNDDPVGNSAHFMVEDYDAGPIIATESYDFTLSDDYVSIRVRVYREANAMMARTVRHVLATAMTPADANPQGAGDLFKPIGDEQMVQVIEKVKNKAYRYMSAK